MNFDLRLPLGLIFGFYGLVLVLYGLLTRGSAAYARSLDLNVNLIWGAVLFVFGASMLLRRCVEKNRPNMKSQLSTTSLWLLAHSGNNHVRWKLHGGADDLVWRIAITHEEGIGSWFRALRFLCNVTAKKVTRPIICRTVVTPLNSGIGGSLPSLTDSFLNLEPTINKSETSPAFFRPWESY